MAEENKEKGKWKLETARAFLSRNKHQVGVKEVRLGEHGGIKSFGAAEYLHNYHGYSLFYYKKS